MSFLYLHLHFVLNSYITIFDQQFKSHSLFFLIILYFNQIKIMSIFISYDFYELNLKINSSDFTINIVIDLKLFEM